MSIAAVLENCLSEAYTQKTKQFTFKASAFSREFCHIVFPMNPEMLPSEEWLIINALEYITFHPKSRAQSDYRFAMVNCDELLFGVCSVPYKYKELCERTGKMFNMKMDHSTRIYAAPTYGLSVTVPKDDHILMFSGARCKDKAVLEKEEVRIKKFGDSLQAETLD